MVPPPSLRVDFSIITSMAHISRNSQRTNEGTQLGPKLRRTRVTRELGISGTRGVFFVFS